MDWDNLSTLQLGQSYRLEPAKLKFLDVHTRNVKSQFQWKIVKELFCSESDMDSSGDTESYVQLSLANNSQQFPFDSIPCSIAVTVDKCTLLYCTTYT